MQPPSVVIAANPYEAELCRRALVETGLQVLVAEGGEGALELVRAQTPLVLVVALGIFGTDPLELVRAARAAQPALPIFLLGDREGEVPDEEAAARLGATRLFLRPIEAEALADAIEKRAVEAELASEVSDAMAEFREAEAEFTVRPPTIDAAPLVEESIVELEAEYEEPPVQPLARIALRRVPTEVVKGVIEVAARPSVEAAREATVQLAAEPPAPAPEADGLEAPPPTATAPEALLRADDALAEAALSSLVVAPDVPVLVEPPAAVEPPPARAPVVLERGDALKRPAFDERSTFARRLDHELSAAERRLFPDSPSTASARRDEYEDALGDIDLDALGIDTIPGIGGDALDAAFDLKPARNGHGGNGAAPAPRPAPLAAAAVPPPVRPLPDDEGELDEVDVATLFASLHAAGYSGAVTLARGDGDKVLYFDAGVPVSARSTFAHDRLVDLLLREGTLSREQHARVRDLPERGRALAQKLVELGLLKSSELFATMRRHVEEILYSCFAWERGRYRLGRDEAASEDRVRLGAHPWALFVEGVRRKYGLERLLERVGPPETVLTPTTLLPRALDDGAFTAAERARAELIDGERTLTELQLAVAGAPLSESALYATAWSLLALGAARVGTDTLPGLGVRAVPTLVTAPYHAADRRTRPRPTERARDRDVDRAIDRERVLAKRAQVQDGDYFAVLGLPRDASAHEVGRAFERLKREFAAERFAEPVRAELHEALAEIGEVLDEAYRVLADDAVRAAYRAHLPPA